MEAADSELARRVQRGDRSAFQVLVIRYRGRVLRLAYRLLRDREDAREIVQEAFIDAYTRITWYNPNRPFSAWLYRIALNRKKPWRCSPGMTDLPTLANDLHGPRR